MKQDNKDRAAQKKNERTRDKDRGERRPAARTRRAPRDRAKRRTQRSRAAEIPEPGLRRFKEQRKYTHSV